MPVAEIGTLVNLLRGGALNTPEDVRCALAVICYGASVLVPVPPRVMTNLIAPMPREEAADHLETLIRPNPGPSGAMRASAAALPWGSILKIVTELLAAWLAAHGG